MMRRTMTGLLAAAALCAGTASASAGALFTDGTFAPASYSTGFLFDAGGVNTITYAQCASCGDPGQALAFTIAQPTGGGAAFGASSVAIGVVNSGFIYDPETQGAIASISASADKNFTVNGGAFNNAFRPLIEQDGTFYAAAIFGPTLSGPGTTGFNAIGNTNLGAADFVRYDPVAGAFGSGHPDFAGDPIEFGVAQLLAAAAVTGLTASTAYDNLSIAVTSFLPEPMSASLLGAGALGLGLLRRRRRG